jgi:hypothetical protein
MTYDNILVELDDAVATVTLKPTGAAQRPQLRSVGRSRSGLTGAQPG